MKNIGKTEGKNLGKCSTTTPYFVQNLISYFIYFLKSLKDGFGRRINPHNLRFPKKQNPYYVG